MKTVLIIAYYFPPVFSAGVYRPLKFAKYLPEYGWKPVILSIKNYRGALLDESLFAELPESTPIYRAYSFELERLENWVHGRLYKKSIPATAQDKINNGSKSDEVKPKPSLLKRYLFSPFSDFLRNVVHTPDNKIGWIPPAVRQGLKAIRREKVDVIFSTSPPESCHLAGLWLSKLADKPHIIDFRDPWTTHFGRQNIPSIASISPHMSPARSKYEKWLERKVLRNTSAAIYIGKGSADLVKKAFPNIAAEKFQVITNGYDEADFDNAGYNIYDPNLTGYLNLVNIGHLYGDSAIGNFLEGFKRALQQQPKPPDIRISFVGLAKDNLADLLTALPLKDRIDILPPKPHGKLIDYIMKADVLLLMPSSGSGYHSDIIVPGKMFELMRTGRPILMIGWQGESSQMIERSGLGKFVSAQDIDGIAQAILDYYDKKVNGNLTPAPDREYIRQFERKNLTGKLAELLDLAVKK
jgi:glycosyltransferase involved in cell wall biosynthesis